MRKNRKIKTVRIRRKEFQVLDEEVINQFLVKSTLGVMAVIDAEGRPYQIPLNFVLLNGAVYFHSSLGGKKMGCIKNGAAVHFNVAEELSLIPSYFTGSDLACEASQYFLSVSIAGEAALVDEGPEKARVLAALMAKYQPEGNHRPIEDDDPQYQKQIKGVAVVSISMEKVTAKFKLGQNLKPPAWEKVIEGLRRRGNPLDHQTAELMERLGK